MKNPELRSVTELSHEIGLLQRTIESESASSRTTHLLRLAESYRELIGQQLERVMEAANRLYNVQEGDTVCWEVFEAIDDVSASAYPLEEWQSRGRLREERRKLEDIEESALHLVSVMRNDPYLLKP